MRLVVTIDTEEDNWGQYAAEQSLLTNIDMIPRLQKMFDDFNVRPTYLLTYPVATSQTAVSFFKTIYSENRCEIGTHLHPWNTPPLEESSSAEASMLCNLPPELQRKKIGILHNAIRMNFGIAPVSFRAGRWGYDHGVGLILAELDYIVDSSVTPSTTWNAYGGPDFSNIQLERPGIRTSGTEKLVEVPATIGFLQNNFTACNRVWKMIDSPTLKAFHLKGILDRLHLLNKVWLSPEVSSSKTMISLARVLMHQGYSVINMFFHSTSLKAGLSPFVRTKLEEERFYERIRDFLSFVQSEGIESVTLSGAVQASCKDWVM